MTHSTILLLNLFLSLIYFILDLKNRINFKSIKIIIFFTLFLNILARVYLSYLVYLNWSRNELGRLLLENFNYFIFYVFSNYFYEFIISILWSVFFLSLMFILNFIFKDILFYKEEFLIIFLAILLASWPFNLFYPIIFFLFVFFGFFGKILLMNFNATKTRISARRFHFVFSMILIILNYFLGNRLIFLKLG